MYEIGNEVIMVVVYQMNGFLGDNLFVSSGTGQCASLARTYLRRPTAPSGRPRVSRHYEAADFIVLNKIVFFFLGKFKDWLS